LSKVYSVKYNKSMKIQLKTEVKVTNNYSKYWSVTHNAPLTSVPKLAELSPGVVSFTWSVRTQREQKAGVQDDHWHLPVPAILGLECPGATNILLGVDSALL
jgi:hypothetical protein